MRNLKRALSLAMASVMLLGMMVVGAGAKGYDDVKETDNVEAIEVLQAIEVMVGDERGFGPDRPVNRAEMAVVMGLLLNLDYNYYSATCPFNDVYDWARGWVGACAANGIVSGRGDGVYDPGATVTAVEGASMLMRALGYFKYPSDYADGFEVSTVRQGTTIGIFDGVGSSATEPMTRNQVAQMVLNALKSGMVQPDGNTLNYFDNNGQLIATGGKINYVYVTSSKAFASAISNTQATSMGSYNDSYIVELGEQLYNGDLKLYGEGSYISDREWDVFGRPARRWEYKGQEIGTYVKKELLKEEYTAKVTGQTLYDLLGKSTVDTYQFQIEIDGVQLIGTNPDANANTILGSAWFDKTDLYRTNKDGVGNTGNGVLTQVYVDTDFAKNNSNNPTYWVYISIINTYLAKSNEDYDAKNDDVQLRTWRLDNKGTSLSPIFVKSTDKVANKVEVDKSKDYCDVYAKGEDFDLVKDVKKDDLYLVQVADGEIQTIQAPEVLSAVTIDAFKLFDHVTTGGETYNHATTARYDVEAIEDWTSFNGALNLKELTYNVVLDDYGYLIGLERNEDANQYVFLTGLEAGASNLYAKQVDGNVIHLDGTMETVKIDLSKSRCGQPGASHKDDRLLAHNTGDNQVNLSQLNTWCTYTVDSNGVYTLKMVPVADSTNVTTTGSNAIKIGQFAQDVDVYNDGPSEVVSGKDTKKINTKRVSLNAAASTSQYVYGNDDTVYLTLSLDKVVVDDTYSGRNKWIVDDVESVITGVKNANLIATDLGADKDGFDNPAAEIYTLYDNKGIVIAAAVIGEDEGNSTSYAYIHTSGLDEESYKHNSSTKSGEGEWTWLRKAIVNGEIVTLKEVGDKPEYLHPSNMLQGEWYEIKYNADGNVRRADKIDYINHIVGEADPAALAEKYVEEVVDVERAVNEYETVLLRDITTVNGLSYKNGTLYTSNNQTRGFSVDPDVKTVLALAGKNGDKKGADWFDSTTDGYKGYIGLEQALREMNAEDYGKFDLAAVQVMALFQNGRATTIIINDLHKLPDNKPTGGNKPSTGSDVTAKDGVEVKDFSGKLEINKFTNAAALDLEFKAPAWAEGANAAADVTLKYTVRVNGDKLVDGTVTGSDLKDKVYTATVTNIGTLQNALNNEKVTANDKITVEVTEATWKYAAVEYYVTDGTTETKIAAADIKAADGTSAAVAKMAIGEANKAAFGFTYTIPANFEADGSLKATYTGMTATEASGIAVTSGTAVNLTNAYADGGKVVKIVIGNVKATQTPEVTEYNVEVASAVTTGLKFAVVDTAPTNQAGIDAIAADEWKDAPVKAEKDKVIVVKAAANGVKLTTFTVANKDYSAGTSASQISTTGVWQFTMPAKDVIVTNAVDDVAKVIHGWVKADGSVINLQTDKTAASLTTMAQKVPLAVEWVNANTSYKAEAVKDLNGAITGMTVNGLTVNTINIGDATTDSVLYVQVDDKDVVTDGTNSGLDDVLTQAGITSKANYFVKKTTSANAVSAVAFDDSNNLANGDKIDTNAGKGWIKTDGTTAITATADVTAATNTLTDANVGTLVLTVTVAADDQFADTNIYVKVGATGTINVKAAAGKGEYTVADKNVKALIGVTGGTVGGSYATAAAVPELAIGEKLDDTTGVNLTFTFETEDAAAGVSDLEVTFTEAT